MKKCYLNNLPKKYGFGANKDKLLISWGDSIGHIVPFEYEDVLGELFITNYSPKKQKVEVEYNSEKYEISTSQLINCSIGSILGKHNKNYIFNYGETIVKNGMGLIVKRFRKGIDNVRHYTLKCLDCSNKYDRSEPHLKDRGAKCPYCGDGVSYPAKFMYSFFKQLNVKIKTEEVFEWLDKCRYDIYIPKHNIILEIHGIQHYNGGFESCGGRSLEEEIENDKIKKNTAINNGFKFIELDCSKSDIEHIKNSILKSELSEVFDISLIDWNKCHEYACSNIIKLACSMFIKGDSAVTKNIAEKLGINRTTVARYLKAGARLGWCDYDPKEIQSLNAGSKNKLKAKPVICVETGQEFESATECARVSMQVFGVQMLQSKVSAVCNGINKSHKGYTFKYKNDTDKTHLDKFKSNKLANEVCGFKLNNEKMSTKEIAQIYNINPSTVREYLIKGTELGLCSYNPEEESKIGSSKSGLSNGKRVEVFKDNVSLGIYESATGLARKSEELFGIRFIQSSISSVCVGKRKSHKGYEFKYVED